MDFLKKNNNIIDYKLVVDLTFDKYNLYYKRKYYLVNYINGNQIVFLTSNEPENDIDEIIEIDQEYTAINDFNELVENFEKSLIIDSFIEPNYNSPPKYIYYDIDFIDENFRELFSLHLKKNISGYNKGDLSKDVEYRVRYWQDYLKTGKLKS